MTVQCTEVCINIATGKQAEPATVDPNGSHPDRITEALTAAEIRFIICMDPASENGKWRGREVISGVGGIRICLTIGRLHGDPHWDSRVPDAKHQNSGAGDSLSSSLPCVSIDKFPPLCGVPYVAHIMVLL